MSGTKAVGGASGLLSIQYGDHWVYDAGTDLLLDADRDGYYRYLRVHFDVDSYFDRAYVYARLYTSLDGESWDFYYETDDFLVTGSTPDDAYEVESELLGNYPPNLYDVLVEIYDADTDVLVDEFGPLESSALSLLPLEDSDFDGVTPAPVVVVTEDGGGGSFSWLALLALAGAAGLSSTRRKQVTR
jgi:MYXO-CTERM domain-containing protein